MGKRKKTVDLLISLTLVATILVSVFVCSYPAVSAAESEDAVTGQEVGEELVDTAAVHRYASFDGVPDVVDADLRHDLSNLYLNQKTVYLDIYGRSQLNVIDAYSGTANAQMTFTSSKMSLYTFVEVFLFKYLSDINVLKAKTLLAISTAYMPWMKLPA